MFHPLSNFFAVKSKLLRKSTTFLLLCMIKIILVLRIKKINKRYCVQGDKIQGGKIKRCCQKIKFYSRCQIFVILPILNFLVISPKQEIKGPTDLDWVIFNVSPCLAELTLFCLCFDCVDFGYFYRKKVTHQSNFSMEILL